MNLLAKSCFCPGIIALLGNLVKSAGEQDLGSVHHLYLKEYLSGMGHEIYRVKLSPYLEKQKFTDIVSVVFKQFEGIIFCLELQIDGEALVILNPGNFEIPLSMKNSTYVYIICEDKKVADQVSTYSVSGENLLTANQQEKERLDQTEATKMELSRVPDWVEANQETEIEGNGENNINLFELDYVVLDEPQNIMNITKISLQGSTKVKDHIVVCGIHSALYSFILPLRARYLKEIMNIVILNPEPPSPDLWSQISIFPSIFYVRGSPLVHEDLARAGIKHAKKAVIMDSTKPKDSSLKTSINDRMVDAESIFIYKSIKKCNPNLQIMIELVYPTNIDFLEQGSSSREDMKMAKQTEEYSYEYLSLYASGEVYISAIIDTLTCQSFYNPHIVTILKQLLSSGNSDKNALKVMGICEEADLKQSNFWQIPVPEDYQNKTFGELFNYLCIQRALIPLGLYRLAGATDNERPYVVTNPPEHIKLTPQDRVFVLGNEMPDDLKEAAPTKTYIQTMEEHILYEDIEEDGDDGKTINSGKRSYQEQDMRDEVSEAAHERLESSSIRLMTRYRDGVGHHGAR